MGTRTELVLVMGLPVSPAWVLTSPVEGYRLYLLHADPVQRQFSSELSVSAAGFPEELSSIA